MQVQNYMKLNRVLIASLLVVLMLTSAMSFFGQDSFSAYARHGNFKTTQHDHKSDLPHNTIKHSKILNFH